MNFLRENIVFKILCLLLAIHILNCSVDTPDPQSDFIPEDLNYNDMESVVEIVLEQVLDINNAIAEHEENDTDDAGSGPSVKKGIDLSFHKNDLTLSFLKTYSTNCKHAVYTVDFASQFHYELTPPPPKA